jgi:hypothetical protein
MVPTRRDGTRTGRLRPSPPGAFSDHADLPIALPMTRLSRSSRTFGACLAAAFVLAAPTAAQASGLNVFGRNVVKPTLKVNARGIALVEYTEAGVRRHVLAWGALNTGPGNTRFDVDYSGGWKSKRADYRRFRNACRAYDGPPLSGVVPGSACKAPDGSYWALQQWRRLIPNYGGTTGPRELRLSHWTGEIAKLEIHTDWGWNGRFHHMFGRYTYRGKPVHGFRTTARGNPLDDFGRNVYVDSFNGQGYAKGWTRVNSFVAQKPHGNFCFLFSPKRDAAQGDGNLAGARHAGYSTTGSHRASVIGPGATPDIVDQPFTLQGSFDHGLNDQLNQLEKQFAVEPRNQCWTTGGAP